MSASRRSAVSSRVSPAWWTKTLGALADFVAPPPPPTKEQAEGMQRAAEERQAQDAAAREQAEKDARLQELLDQIKRRRRTGPLRPLYRAQPGR